MSDEMRGPARQAVDRPNNASGPLQARPTAARPIPLERERGLLSGRPERTVSLRGSHDSGATSRGLLLGGVVSVGGTCLPAAVVALLWPSSLVPVVLGVVVALVVTSTVLLCAIALLRSIECGDALRLDQSLLHHVTMARRPSGTRLPSDTCRNADDCAKGTL